MTVVVLPVPWVLHIDYVRHTKPTLPETPERHREEHGGGEVDEISPVATDDVRPPRIERRQASQRHIADAERTGETPRYGLHSLDCRPWRNSVEQQRVDDLP